MTLKSLAEVLEEGSDQDQDLWGTSTRISEGLGILARMGEEGEERRLWLRGMDFGVKRKLGVLILLGKEDLRGA